MKKRKIMYTVFFIFLITITCTIVDINRKGIKNKREKVLSAENNSIKISQDNSTKKIEILRKGGNIW